MSNIDWKFLLADTRARVYLYWAVTATAGFVATHYRQEKLINGLWFFITVVGLGYMYKVMPMGVKQMRNIFLSWFVPLTIGMVVSGVVFYLTEYRLVGEIIGHLGVFWLLVMAVGYILNGISDRPSNVYWFAAGLNIAAAVLCLTYTPALVGQYLLAAIVTAWSMLYLWILRAT